MDAPGLVFLCRDSGLRPGADPVDSPFSTRFDEQDALCIFGNVEIPKRDVFINSSVEVYNQVMGGSSWWPNIMQQTTIRALTKLEFTYGLLVRMAEAVNDTSERTMELLGEVLGYIEVTRNAILLSELNAKTWEEGGVYPEARALHPMRTLLPDWFTRVNDIPLIGEDEPDVITPPLLRGEPSPRERGRRQAPRRRPGSLRTEQSVTRSGASPSLRTARGCGSAATEGGCPEAGAA